jgi:hypothetical protein
MHYDDNYNDSGSDHDDHDVHAGGLCRTNHLR